MNDAAFFEYLERKKRGEDYTILRKDMQERGYNEDVIKAALREIDDEVLKNAQSKASKERQRAFQIVGWGIILASAVTFLILYVNRVRGGLIIVAVLAAMFSGVAILARSRGQHMSKIHNKKWRR